MTKTKSLWSWSFFHCELEWCDLFKLIHWAFELCVFKYSNASLFRAQHSGESYHNGLILPEWHGNLLVQDCVIVMGFFFFLSLVLSVGWLSDVLVTIFTSSDKSVILAPDSAWKQLLKMDTAKLNIGQRGTNIEISVKSTLLAVKRGTLHFWGSSCSNG